MRYRPQSKHLLENSSPTSSFKNEPVVRLQSVVDYLKRLAATRCSRSMYCHTEFTEHLSLSCCTRLSNIDISVTSDWHKTTSCILYFMTVYWGKPEDRYNHSLLQKIQFSATQCSGICSGLRNKRSGVWTTLLFARKSIRNLKCRVPQANSVVRKWVCIGRHTYTESTGLCWRKRRKRGRKIRPPR